MGLSLAEGFRWTRAVGSYLSLWHYYPYKSVVAILYFAPLSDYLILISL